MKLPASLTTADATQKGSALKANGGALFIKLLSSPAGYIGANDKVKVTLTNVTATTDDEGAGQSQPYGIYIDDGRDEKKNLEVTSGIDNNFVRFNTPAED